MGYDVRREEGPAEYNRGRGGERLGETEGVRARSPAVTCMCVAYLPWHVLVDDRKASLYVSTLYAQALKYNMQTKS